jgi:hypothetical protein
MSRVRVIWPSVPFVVAIRNPVEVIASNLALPADWVKTMLAHYGENNVFGLTGPETRRTTAEEYCAREVGMFLGAANAQIDDKCQVLDFARMTLGNIYRVAKAHTPHR